jgi:hypothetical protein
MFSKTVKVKKAKATLISKSISAANSRRPKGAATISSFGCFLYKGLSLFIAI